MKRTGGEVVFSAINYTVMLIFVFLCLAPFLHIFSLSLSSNRAILSGMVTIFPVELDFTAYDHVLKDNSMLRSIVLTIVLTFSYTAASMLMTIAAAFPLSQTRLKGRKLFMFIIIFTMFFSGGMIPEYLLVKDLQLTNSLLSLILPLLINPFFLIILINFFRAIPPSLSEAAEIDGSSHVGILTRVILPLSLPGLATLSLFYIVGRWNGFMDALMYITNPDLYPIQLKLYQIVMNGMTNELTSMDGERFIEVLPESMKAASIMFATIPILLVYPWLQKYFISGVMLGAVKE